MLEDCENDLNSSHVQRSIQIFWSVFGILCLYDIPLEALDSPIFSLVFSFNYRVLFNPASREFGMISLVKHVGMIKRMELLTFDERDHPEFTTCRIKHDN